MKANKNLIPGTTTINGSKYIILRRINVISAMILGAIVMTIGAFKLQTTFGAFLFGAGLIACLLSVKQLGQSLIGYRKLSKK